MTRILLPAACALTLAAAPSARAFCVTFDILGFEVWCSDAGHVEITEQLDFLAPGMVSLLTEYDADEDSGSNADDPRRHVDSCSFEAWTAYANTRYAEAIAAMSPADPRPADAAVGFGRLLHGIQDFYAHSNWVEIMESMYGVGGYSNEGAILDRGTGPWPILSGGTRVHDGRIVVGAIPSAPTADNVPVSTVFPDYSAIPTFTMSDGAVLPALVTGWNPGRSCYDLRPGTIVDAYSDDGQPRDRNLVHGNTYWDDDPLRPCEDDTPTSVCANKDRPVRPYYAEAELLAILQTQQEWCRLLSQAEVTGGPAESTALLSVWGGTSSPVPPMSATCSPRPAGPVEVKIEVSGVDVDHRAVAAQATYALSAHDADFHHVARSARTTSATTSPSAPDPLRMCVDAGSGVSVGLWGVDEVPVWQGIDVPGVDSNDVVLRGGGFTQPAGVSGATTVSGPDVTFTATITFEPDDTDYDSDGLSACGEAYYGTDPYVWDTDGDFLPDGFEANVLGTDPANPDTDGDYLGDGEGLTYGTDPEDPDSDDDGLVDGLEVWLGTDPLRADTDGDGLSDGHEVDWGLDPLSVDSDNDGLDDGMEGCCYELAPDTDVDGRPDAVEADWDLSPKAFDTDGDGLGDGIDPSPARAAIERGLVDAVLPLTEKGEADRAAVLDALSLAEKYAADGQSVEAAAQVLAAKGLVAAGCVDLDPADKVTVDGEVLALCLELDHLAAALTPADGDEALTEGK